MNNICFCLVHPALQPLWSPELCDAVDVGTELATPQSSSPDNCAFCHAVVPQEQMTSHLYSHFSDNNDADDWQYKQTDGPRPQLLPGLYCIHGHATILPARKVHALCRIWKDTAIRLESIYLILKNWMVHFFAHYIFLISCWDFTIVSDDDA